MGHRNNYITVFKKLDGHVGWVNFYVLFLHRADIVLIGNGANISIANLLDDEEISSNE